MSAPEPNFDQLLSDHLDGRLDQADAQMLQQSMRENPVLQSQFDLMRADREAVRTLFASQQSTGPRLSSDFAARVLAESRRRGLPSVEAVPSNKRTTAPAGPTVLCCQEPQVSAHQRPLAWIIGLVATAAAILLIVSLTTRERRLEQKAAAIAQRVPAAQSPSVPQRSGDPLPHGDHGGEPTSTSEVASAPVELQSDLLRVPDASEPPQPSSTVAASMPAPAERLERSARLPPASVPSASVAAASETPVLGESPFAGGMIVYDVRLSPQGRQTNVMSEAMRQVGLDDVPRMPVNREVIAAAKRADTFDEDAKFQVIYVQASAKRVDRLFLNLLREPKLVEAVRLSLVTDAPILKKANRLARVDATKVRHEDQFSFELENNASNELAAFRELLGEQSFEPLPPVASRAAISQPDSLSSTGSDVISHVLILVR